MCPTQNPESSPPKKSDHSGHELSGFRLERHVTTGGMSDIYYAAPAEVSANRWIPHRAVKILRADLAEKPIIRDLFRREARILSNYPHPHIVGIYAHGSDEKVGDYMVLEWLQGQHLKSYLRQAPKIIPNDKFCKWLDQLCEALDSLHRRGVVHQDLKPENIFLSGIPGRRQVKLLDLGIALDPKDTEKPKHTAGTLRYMSPEQLLSENIGAHSDIYALGIVLFEMFTRRPVFTKAEHPDTKEAHLTITAPKISDVRPDLAVPEAFEALLASALDKNPAKRPANARILAKEAIAILEAEPVTIQEIRQHSVVRRSYISAAPQNEGITEDIATAPPT